MSSVYYSECILKIIEVIQRECNLLVYLAGDVVMIARSDEDIERFLYAATYPPYIDRKDISTLRMSASLVINESTIAITDIKSYTIAKILTSELAKVLEIYMPFYIDGIDMVISYRASEDGGLYTRYEIRIPIKDRSVVEKILEKVLSIAKELGIDIK